MRWTQLNAADRLRYILGAAMMRCHDAARGANPRAMADIAILRLLLDAWLTDPEYRYVVGHSDWELDGSHTEPPETDQLRFDFFPPSVDLARFLAPE